MNEPHAAAAEPGPLYAQVLESTRLLLTPGRSVPVDEIASHAWAHLTEQQRADAVSVLMTSYASQVHYEQAEQSHTRAASDPDVTTYLGDFDMAMLWDTHADTTSGPDETTVDRRALLNVLCEVELLRHRLAMARNETSQD